MPDPVRHRTRHDTEFLLCSSTVSSCSRCEERHILQHPQVCLCVSFKEVILKTLIAYFSASGVTAAVAKKLASAIDADLYEILPRVPYSAKDLDWQNPKSRSSIEMNTPDMRPIIADGHPLDPAPYDRIFLGFPIWWYISPNIINTFLESSDFSGKTIILFATSGGSGFGKTVQRLQPSAPGAKIIEGRILNGSPDEKTLKLWAEGFAV